MAKFDYMGFAGKAIGAVGSIMEGFAQSRSLKASAKAVEQEAEEVRKRNIWDQIRLNEQTRSDLSAQRQLVGQSGLKLEGAPMELMQRTKQEYVLERMVRSENAASEVSALGTEAKELKKAAKHAKRSAVMGAFGSFF